MRYKWIIALTILIVAIIIIANYTGLFGTNLSFTNDRPTVTITYPENGATVSKLVMISGTAENPDSNTNLKNVQIKINGHNRYHLLELRLDHL
jgi:hypothetical protein